MKTWKILGRHKYWVDGATITESICELDKGDIPARRFTATIRGFQNWPICEGNKWNVKKIIEKVRTIRDRIDANDETVFTEPSRI